MIEKFTLLKDGVPYAHVGGKRTHIERMFPDAEIVLGTLEIAAVERPWRQKRNALLDQWLWVVSPGSPITNQEDWLEWRSAMNSLGLFYGDFLPDDAWPPLPRLDYA